MVVRRWLLVAALVLPVTAGCYEAKISNPDLWFLDVVQDTATPDEGPADLGPADPGPTDVADVPGDVPPVDVPLPDKDRATGSPCEEDGQCWTMMCLTTAFLQLMNPNLEAPGGLCSYLGCAGDNECGPNDGSKCIDATGLSADVPFLCGKPCTGDAQCRAEYVCPDVGAKDMGGAPVKMCLPTKMVQLLLCDKGACTTEPKDPYCPAACPQ